VVAIKTEGLTKEYRVGFWQRKVRVLHDLNLEVYEGEIFGYLGPNGAGKTTTLKLLNGLVFPTAEPGGLTNGVPAGRLDILSLPPVKWRGREALLRGLRSVS